MSLVSLVVLGIFGRNTGFGPSMSLNNIIDHKRDVYVQKKRNVFALNFHKMYEHIVLKSVLSIFICPTLVLGAWWNRGVESWGDQCSRKRDQEAPQCHLQKRPYQMFTISVQKRPYQMVTISASPSSPTSIGVPFVPSLVGRCWRIFHFRGYFCPDLPIFWKHWRNCVTWLD